MDTVLGRELTSLEQEFARTRSLESFNLSTRAYKVLKTLNCGTLFEIATCQMRTLALTKNVGKKTIDEIVAVVRRGSEDYSEFLANRAIPSEVVAPSPNSITTNDVVDLSQTHSIGRLLSFDVCLRGNLVADEQKFAHSLRLDEMGLSTRACNILKRLRCKSLFDVASTTPQKILRVKGSGRKTLGEIESRVRELFANRQHGVQNKVFLSPATRKNEKQLREVFRLYEKHGTLEAVGQAVGVSRERIRQLLVQGTKAGLYIYNPKKYVSYNAQKLLDDYRSLGSIKRVAQKNSLNSIHVAKALKQHGVTADQLRFLRDEALREHCANDFKALAEKLGHFPNATELQRIPGRALYARIANHWGSIDKLREHLNLPIPTRGNPRFAEDVRKWRSKKRRLQALAMLGDSDAILECLQDAAGLGRPAQK